MINRENSIQSDEHLCTSPEASTELRQLIMKADHALELVKQPNERGQLPAHFVDGQSQTVVVDDDVLIHFSKREDETNLHYHIYVAKQDNSISQRCFITERRGPVSGIPDGKVSYIINAFREEGHIRICETDTPYAYSEANKLLDTFLHTG